MNSSQMLRHGAGCSYRVLALTALLTLGTAIPLPAQLRYNSIPVEVDKTIRDLVIDEDTDGDLRITIHDMRLPGTDRGDRRFRFATIHGDTVEVDGTYYLANLLQDLTRARQQHLDTVSLDGTSLFLQPAERITRAIAKYYWDGLTRRVDESGLLKVVTDEKATRENGLYSLYVPPADTAAQTYFAGVARRHPEWHVQVVVLPEYITPEYVNKLNMSHGLLSLSLVRLSNGDTAGAPFVVPGGRFNEMYGWDSYFILLGLLQDGRVALAKAIVDNMVYEIDHYGAVLNANRTYYLTRSQPPFLIAMAREVYPHLPPGEARHRWLAEVVKAGMKEYELYWMNDDHRTPIGLTRYFDRGQGVPPEVEVGHFDRAFERFAAARKDEAKHLEDAYRSGAVTIPELDRYFEHDRAMRESGHDTSYRLEGICADLATVDLNSLLYATETGIADILTREFGGVLQQSDSGSTSTLEWQARAANRQWLMQTYMWDEEAGMYFDYDFVRNRQHRYVSATTFYPLWAGLASPAQARALAEKALPLLEESGGVAASSEASRGELSPERQQRQWDYPFGWAPHQMLIWQGLRNYGEDSVALRLAYKWLYTITMNATFYNGMIPEKFDVVKRSHEVFAEYGNVGTDFAYVTNEGFGWTNASFQVGFALLPQALRERLNELVPPEWLFGVKGRYPR